MFFSSVKKINDDNDELNLFENYIEKPPVCLPEKNTRILIALIFLE